VYTHEHRLLALRFASGAVGRLAGSYDCNRPAMAKSLLGKSYGIVYMSHCKRFHGLYFVYT
jgi:hypothetical protein